MGNIGRKMLREKHREKPKDSEKLETAKQTLRIAVNVQRLLIQGLFPGDSSHALAEARDWMNGMVENIQSTIPAEPKKEKPGDEKKEPTKQTAQ